MYSSLHRYSYFYTHSIEKFSDTSLILDLTPTSFSIVYKKPTIVLFYATWCHHCTAFKPIFDSISREADINEQDVSFYIFDCDQSVEFVDQFDVVGLPTVILFNNGKRYTYEGNRTVKDVYQWLESKL